MSRGHGTAQKYLFHFIWELLTASEKHLNNIENGRNNGNTIISSNSSSRSSNNKNKNGYFLRTQYNT